MNTDKVRYALDRLTWADTEYEIWRRRFVGFATKERIKRLKLQCKTSGLINHDRVLTDRDSK